MTPKARQTHNLSKQSHTGNVIVPPWEHIIPRVGRGSWGQVPVPMTQGELTIIGQDGKTKVVHEGEAVVEMVGTIHHGENCGTKPVILYMFYLSQKDLPLAVQHPDIPLE